LDMSVEKVKVEVELPKGLVDFLRDIGNLTGNEKYAEEYITWTVVCSVRGDMDELKALPFFDENELKMIKQKYGVKDW